jgi:nitrogen fixation-related uncharacterized protein
MRRVVPSQIVEFIDRYCGEFLRPPTAISVPGKRPFPYPTPGVGHFITPIQLPTVRVLNKLLNCLADELLPSDESDFHSFLMCVNQVRSTASADSYGALWAVDNGDSPVRVIRELLTKCPDESASAASNALTLIPDTTYRDNLRTDLGAVNRALSNGEWKAATVLAGSVVEALLLWAIRTKREDEIGEAVKALLDTKTLKKKPATEPENWHLSEMNEVVRHFGLISEATACQVRLAKDFRNLIHPGRAVRLEQDCNRATALTAVAAIEHVLINLEKQFVP